MSAQRPRLLISLEHGVLEDAVVRVLEAADVDDIVCTQHPSGDFDAAITAGPLPRGVCSELIIELGANAPSRGRFVDDTGEEQVIDLRDLAAVIDLLDDRCEASARRRSCLPPLHG